MRPGCDLVEDDGIEHAAIDAFHVHEHIVTIVLKVLVNGACQKAAGIPTVTDENGFLRLGHGSNMDLWGFENDKPTYLPIKQIFSVAFIVFRASFCLGEPNGGNELVVLANQEHNWL